MNNDLRLGENFNAPAGLLTSATGILGVRGAGKTNSAGDIVEEAVRIGVPAAVIDPTGAWYGLKSSADGKAPGLPVYIFGGEHADIPLEPEAGALLGRFIVEKRVPAVLDLALMRKGQQIRFVAEFAEYVYHKNREPLLIVIDECARFCPQNTRGLMSPDVGRCIGAVDDIVALGRNRGLGALLIGQRGARINKDVLTQCQTLLCHNIVGPQDRDAVNEWVKEQHGGDEQAREFMRELTALPVGTAFVWSPTVLKVFKKVKMRNRWTFDSSATPEIGKKLITPQVFAKVDLSELSGELAELKTRADADDPKVLRARIRELEAHVCEAPASPVSVMTEEQETLLKLEVSSLESILKRIEELPFIFTKATANATADLAAVFGGVYKDLAPIRENLAKPEEKIVDRKTIVHPSKASTNGYTETVSGELSKSARALLVVVSQYPDGVTQSQLAITAGYSRKSGSLFAALALLRRLEYIDKGQPIRITTAGRRAVGPVEKLPTGPALREYWYEKLEKAPSLILRELCKLYPKSASQSEIASRCGYSERSGSLFEAMARLRALKLIDGPGSAVRASEVLFG